jgi:hypothetical protein
MLPSIDLARQHQLARRLQQRQRADHYFYLDIVGTCSLRCPSCAVGNSGQLVKKGLMSLDDYQGMLEKIKTDYRDYKRIFIDLYNWGEPALHPELASIIRTTRDYGMGVGISSNLNAVPDLRDIVKAEPDYIRISLSGFYDATYRMTHKGGNVLAVKSNMCRLAELCQRYRSNTVVQVGFHIYRGNFPRDFLAMRELCDELGFLFAPVLATLMPAERALQVARGDNSGVDQALLDNLVIPINESLQMFERLGPPTQDCQHRQARSTVTWDGTVALCCATYDSPPIAERFLDTSPAELKRLKYSHSFCQTCMNSHVNKLYIGHERRRRQEAAVAVLGPTYQSFLDETQHLGEAGYVVVGGSFKPTMEIYEAGMRAMSEGRDDEAETFFRALTDGAPDFGEGFFQAGQMAMKLGDQRKALSMYAEAVQLAPTHVGYRTAWQDTVSRLKAESSGPISAK